jgi:hypothetical protein
MIEKCGETTEMNVSDKSYWTSIVLTACIFIVDSVFFDYPISEVRMWETMVLLILFNLLFKGEKI